MNKFFKRIFGIAKIEEATAQANAEAAVAQKLAEQKIKEAADAEAKLVLAKLTPKELANKKGEPWVAVLDTKVNIDNPRNGFFELDWNEQFIAQLKISGYGFDGDPEEEIVDRWFRDLARNMLGEDGLDQSRSAGFINVTRLANGKAQVE